MKKFLGLFTVLFIMAIGAFAMAQTAPVAGAAPAVPQWLIDTVSKFPKMSEVLFIMGALRLTLKPFFAFMHTFFQSWGLVAFDQKELAVEQSSFMKGLYFILDYVGSIKVPVSQQPDSASTSEQKSA